MDLSNIVNLFKDKYGLEIGGPSHIFRHEGILPIYPIVQGLDGVNFSENTLWEHDLKEGSNYVCCEGSSGVQFICEVTELSKRISQSTYDFVVSSNCFEHIANPLKAMKECLSAIKSQGILMLVLPRKEVNFDHNRSEVSFQHILSDWTKEIGEGDFTHLNEILEFHDLVLDPYAGTFEQFKTRSLQNHSNRALHHHVFDLEVLSAMYKFFGVEVLESINTGFEYIIVGRKGN
jgi:SAM-dependent methyltransferase